MSKSETVELLELLFKAGLVEKRVSNGMVQWRITEKGKTVSREELEKLTGIDA